MHLFSFQVRRRSVYYCSNRYLIEVYGLKKLAGGSKELAGCSKELAGGSKELAGGSKKLAEGSKELAGGSKKLAGGFKKTSGRSLIQANQATLGPGPSGTQGPDRYIPS